jgi:hypothetical protein
MGLGKCLAISLRKFLTLFVIIIDEAAQIVASSIKNKFQNEL